MDKVLVDGVDVTALVDGVLTDWQSSKTLSFADSATDLTVCGSDLIAIDRSGGELWCPDGDMTACAGFAWHTPADVPPPDVYGYLPTAVQARVSAAYRSAVARLPVRMAVACQPLK